MAKVNQSVTSKLATARLSAMRGAPYLTQAVFALIPYPAPGLGTLGVTEKGIMLYDPEIVEKLSVEELGALLLHEVSHYLRDHMGRCKTVRAHPMLWNLAADAEINDDLVQICDGHGGKGWPNFPSGDPLPGPVLPKNLLERAGLKPDPMEDGKLAEAYYAKLRDEIGKQDGDPNGEGDGDGQDKSDKGGGGQDQQKQQGSGKGQGQQQQKQQGQDSGDGQGGGEGEDQSEEGGEGGTGHKPNPHTQHGGWRCGSGAGNSLGDFEPDEGECPGRTEAEREMTKRQVAEEIRNEAQKGRGTIPGGWSQWAETYLGKPQIPWEQKLARVCRRQVEIKAGMTDVAFDRPSRWQGVFGFGEGSLILPRTIRPVPNVMILIDTSGSMSDDELSVAVTETVGVMKTIDADVTLCVFDARVHCLDKVRTAKEVQERMRGRGGTDLVPAFKAAEEARPRPDIVICMTDGGGPAPRKPPTGVNVVWVLVGQHRMKPWCEDSYEEKVSYGDFIEVDTLERHK